MRVDGKKIAQDIQARVRDALSRSGRTLSLGVLSVGGDAVTEQFIGIKKRTAEAIGVAVVIRTLSTNVTTEDVARELAVLTAQCNGVVLQLPLPEHIDREVIVRALPASHDVDCMGVKARRMFERGDSPLLPPVVAAIKEILERYSIDVSGKNIVVAGRGMLVGAPALVWFKNNGACVVGIDEQDDARAHTRSADIVVLGTGQPNFLVPDMIREGSVVLDAGTSESRGRIVGDADPACEQKAALLSPVPGGIGPIAVAKIFENLLICNSIGV